MSYGYEAQRRKDDSSELYTYTTELDDGGSGNYYSSAPSAPAGYAAPPTTTPAPVSPAASSGPTDEEIDAMLAAGGGRISSRAMRALETKGRSSNLPAWPPQKPVEKTPTELKREKIMSRIPKTKTRDSEGGDLSFAARDDAPLAGKNLVSKYEGEDKSVAWRAAEPEVQAERWGMDVNSPEFKQRYEKLKGGDQVTTRYDTDRWDREKSRLEEKGDGRVKATHDKRQYGDRDESGWVMDPSSGNIHTFDPGLMPTDAQGKKKTTHHSSPLAGGNVAGAGMMSIRDKHITEVTDESGHYRPEGEYTYQAVKEMASRGLLDREADEDDVDEYEAGEGNLSARVSLAGYVENDPRQQKGWLKDEEGISKDKLTLPYQAFLQTRGNERQARAKVSMHDELKQKVPKIGEDEGSKAVRKGMRGASSLNSASGSDAPAIYEDYQPDAPAIYEDYQPDAPVTYVDHEPEIEVVPGYSTLNQHGEIVPAADDAPAYEYESSSGYSVLPDDILRRL